jgi:hypothetical protein
VHEEAMAHWGVGGGCRAKNKHYNALVAFLKLRKVIISFLMSVYMSLYLRGTVWLPTGRIFVKFDVYTQFFRKSFERILVSLKFDKNNGYFT